MAVDNASFARRLRVQRLFRRGDGRLLVVPLDHSITDGPLGCDLDALLGEISGTGVDAVVLHKGSLRHVDPACFTDMSLIVHLSASTRHAADPDAKYLVADVDEALRLGAEAVSVHVNLGSPEEAGQIADLAAVSRECENWNVPLLAMVYARGPKIGDPRAPELVGHAATLAADLGADVVKTDYAGTPEQMAEVVRACPIPVIVAGGPRAEETSAVLSYVSDALRGGAAGVAVGRNIFQASHPGQTAAAIARLVHGLWYLPDPGAVDSRLALASANYGASNYGATNFGVTNLGRGENS